ncbi:MAG TPA: hypothetical protein VD884_18555 [Ohtaekwangia sp.]|nr:hypothetical protein [Ohtaekwangia sp.]
MLKQNAVSPEAKELVSPAVSLTVKYVVLGMLWILFSDSILSWMGPDNMLLEMSHIHILKGVMFIGVTGGFLFYLVHDLHQSLMTKTQENHNLFLKNPCPLILVDVKTLQVSDSNESAQKIFGYDAIGFRTMHLQDLIIESERDRFMSQSVSNRLTDSYRKLGSWRMTNNEKKEVIIQLEAVRNNNRKLLFLLSDVTAQVKAETELRTMDQTIEQKIAQRTLHLERLNEELMFRARATEQVNAELIFVNERLQSMNKRK